MQTIELWTDGSCNPNPGSGGWAAILVNADNKEVIQESYGGEPATTNNRMEMTAIINGLNEIPEQSHVTIYSDSEVTINCAIGFWKRKKNRDLWQQYDQAAVKHKVVFKKVKAHQGIALNERADQLANRGRLMVEGQTV